MRLKSMFSNKEIAILALLSTLWAAVEISIGLFLKTFKVPFSGALLTFIGLTIIFMGRFAVPRYGTAIFMGITTCFLKFIYLGGLAIYPVIGILIEVLLIEFALFKAQPIKINYILSGILALLWTLVHPFLTHGLLGGWGISKVFSLLIRNGSLLLGIREQQAWFIIGIIIFLHINLGILAGAGGWRLSQIIFRRISLTRA